MANDNGSDVPATITDVRGRSARVPASRKSATPGRAIRNVATAPASVAKAVTGGASRGDTVSLSTALLTGFVLVMIRAVADFETSTVSTTSGDTSVTKGKVLHTSGQYGPIPIAAGLIISFFFLSLLATGGGVRAKIASLFGWLIVIVLALNSVTEIDKIAGTIGRVGSIAAGAPAGSESSGASSTSSAAAAAAVAAAAASGAGTSATAAASPMTAADNALSAAGHDIMSIKSPVTDIFPVTNGKLQFDPAGVLQIPGTVVDDALDLVNAAVDLTTAGVDAVAPNVSNPVTNFVNGLKSDFDKLKSLF
jgi:protein-S-isoprenylcysteine O-methyltransferase Ste14